MGKKPILSFFICVVIAVIAVTYFNIPSNIYLPENFEKSLEKTGIFSLSGPVKATSAGHKADVKFLGIIPVKEVNVNLMPDVEVVAAGELVGIRLYTEGLLVVDTARFEDETGTIVEPAMEAGIKNGDIIVTINGEPAESIEQFSKIVNSLGSNSAELLVYRENKEFKTTIKPKLGKSTNQYRIGVWVRDSMAGIGTLTFCRTDNMKFVALGHGIVDADVGAVYKVKDGNITNAEIIDIQKGKKGMPGEIKGAFKSKGINLGSIEANTSKGVFGTMEGLPEGKRLKAAARSEIIEGPATILCNVNNKIKSYNIEIQKMLPASSNSAKSMLIKVTDEELLETTGGIVQGMSGSPIIQNDKFIGAVTHVFVNDPTRGYGIFADHLIELTN